MPLAVKYINQKIVDHITELLFQVLYPLLKSNKFCDIRCKNRGQENFLEELGFLEAEYNSSVIIYKEPKKGRVKWENEFKNH